MSALPRLVDPVPGATAASGTVARRSHLRAVPRSAWTFVDAAREATRPRLARIAVPLGVSAAIHGVVLLAIFAMLGGGGGSPRTERAAPMFTATLIAPSHRFVVPEQSKPPEPSTTGASPARAVPGPIQTSKKKPVARYTGSAQGQASIAPVDADTPAEAWLETFARDLYPGVLRTTAEFEHPPESVFPKAAVAARRQAAFTIPVLLKTDGTVELMPQTFMDTLFAPAVAASLTKARVAAIADETEVKVAGWALLTYMFEFTGEKSD